MYALGMTTRDIQSHLQEMYGVDVSPTLVSPVTDAIADEVKQWQNRLLDEVYPILYLDAIRVKVRHNGRVVNKAGNLAIGVTVEGMKEVLGMWTAENEGAKFWLHVRRHGNKKPSPVQYDKINLNPKKGGMETANGNF